MLDIVPVLLLLVAVIFIFLIIVLNKMLYVPLLNFMSDREKSIENDMEQAKKNSSNVSHLEKEASKIIKEAKVQAFEIREKAITIAKAEVSKEIEAKKFSLEKAYESFIKEIEDEKEELKTKLMNSFPDFQTSLKTKLSQI